MAAERVVVAALMGAFGVSGAVRLKSFTAEPEAVARYGPLEAPDGRVFAVALEGPLKGGFAARLSGVSTREQAEALRGLRLSVPRARLPDPGPDEFYHADLIGLEALDPGGAPIGRVRAVLDFGAGDILEIARASGEALLVPFTREAVPMVDPALGRIVIDPPEDEDAGGEG